MSNLARCIAKARAVIEAMKLEIAAREAGVKWAAIVEANKNHPCWAIDSKDAN